VSESDRPWLQPSRLGAPHLGRGERSTAEPELSDDLIIWLGGWGSVAYQMQPGPAIGRCTRHHTDKAGLKGQESSLHAPSRWRER